MSDTAQRSSAPQERSQNHQQPDVRVYAGPTHEWAVLAKIDLSQCEAERLAVTPGATPSAESISGYSDITCWKCELTYDDASETCSLG